MKIETRALLTIGLLIGLFIFVVCVSVFGQDTENVYTPPMAGWEQQWPQFEISLIGSEQELGRKDSNGVWTFHEGYAAFVRFYLLTLYDQYKESLSGLYVSDGPKEGFTESLYTPKEPTFTGFMEFIREKQK